jgi:thioredoxin-dependent peroxiredoxin
MSGFFYFELNAAFKRKCPCTAAFRPQHPREFILTSHPAFAKPRIRRTAMHGRNLLIVVFAVVLAAVLAWSGALSHAASLQPGAAAPNFTLPSQENTPVSLTDYRGKWVVLYFYPKDMSSGCSLEAHNFQRDQARYDAVNAVVLGVSLDSVKSHSVKSHETFCTKDSLSFKLLADPDHKVIDAYGVQVMFGKFAQRDTFLISPEGRIVKFWKVSDIKAHSGEVLEAIAAEKK